MCKLTSSTQSGKASRIEKRMPAMAAARGALKLAAVNLVSGFITSSWECIGLEWLVSAA